MKKQTYSIFGAGAAGLYTAWRLLSGKSTHAGNPAKLPGEGDVLELYDWGKYNFSKANPGSRAPGARVCTWHYQDDPTRSYVELGGMRYAKWETKPAKGYDPNDGTAGGHRVVTTVIEQLNLDQYSVPFNESGNPLYYLRTKNMFLNGITSTNPAPYNVDRFAASASPNQGFATLESLGVSSTAPPLTRSEWDELYHNGKITVELPERSIFQKGDVLSDIGYWNLMYDQLGSEGYNYVADGNGYSSNVINWNAADAFQNNDEFTPGNSYYTLTTGYSGMFTALFDAIVKLAKKKKVDFNYFPDTRLHSIVERDQVIHYTYATRVKPWHSAGQRTTDFAWLAMPRFALDLVAQATRFAPPDGLDVLNHHQVKLYMESTIMQPSYKVGMFFDQPWWETATYAPQLTSYVMTGKTLARLREEKFPEKYLHALQDLAGPKAYADTPSFVAAVQGQIKQILTYPEQDQLLKAALSNTIGPSITDTPSRMIVYFGNNAQDQTGKPIYGILASYDDESFTTFWEALELDPSQRTKVPFAEDTQPLEGPRTVPPRMVKMLRKQLAEVHFGPSSDYSYVPEPKEAKYIDWSLPPFNAGYHAWAAHFDVPDVQQKIRKPSQLIEGASANIFIVGEAYSNDQAWVEGAFCTAESVLNDFFGVEPIIDSTNYPFICRNVKHGGKTAAVGAPKSA